jgi:TP901 family phage tail tape measure protein
VAALADTFLRLRVDSTQVQKDVSAGVKKAAESSDATSAGQKVGNLFASGFKQVMSVALAAGLTVGITAAFATAIKGASEFGASMEMVHTQAGASQASVESLSKSILALGGKVQQTPVELANAMFHLKSVGLDDADAMKALQTASNLAAVGGANLEDTTNALAGAWRSGINGAQSFSQAAGTVNAIIGAGNMRMQDFVSAIGTGILPAAKSFGLSLSQVGAALALMTDEGIPAVDAATRLRMSFSLLAAPSGAADKQLAKIGLSGLDLANAMRSPSGLIGAISLLKQHLDASGLSAAKQSILLSQAFGGGRSSSAILTLLNNLTVLKQKQDQVNSSTGKYGPAVAAQQKTAAAQFAMLRSLAETVGIELANYLVPPLSVFAGLLARNIVPAFHEVGQLMSATVGYIKPVYALLRGNATALLAVAAAATAAFTAFRLFSLAQVAYAAVSGGIVAAINAVKFAMFALQYAFVTNPVGILILALVALGAALVVLWERSSTFRNIVEGAWRAVEAAALSAWNNGIKPAVNGLITAYHAILAAWGTVASFFTGVADAVIGAFDRIKNFVTSSFDNWWKINGDAIKELWQGLWQDVEAIFTPVWDFITIVLRTGWALIVGMFQTDWLIISTIWNTGWAVISAVARTTWNLIVIDARTAWGMITAIFSTAWAVIQAAWSAGWTTLKAIFDVFWSAVETVVKVAWDVIVGLFGIAINLLTGHWHDAWLDLQNMVIQVWNAINAFLRTALGAAESIMQAGWNAIDTSARAVWNGIQSFFGAWWNGVRATFSTAVSGIGAVLSAAWNGISRVAQDAFNGLKSALATVWGGIKAVLESPIVAVVNAVINPFISGIDTVLSWVGLPGIPKIPGLAAGGMVHAMIGGGRLPGYGGGDRRLIMAEDGETVVSKSTSRAMAPLFSIFGVPGYAGGGIIGDIIGAIPGASAVVDAAKFVSGDVLSALNFISNAASSIGAAVGSGHWASVVGQVAEKVVTAPVSKIEGLVKSKIVGPITSFLKSLVTTAPGTTRAGVSNASALAALQSAAAKLGWTGAEWAALNNVEMAEAGYNLTATNPQSGAYGMAQFIQGAAEYAQYGGDSTTPAGQATAMVNYIAQRYGDPIAAWAHEQQFHWYRKGGAIGRPWRRYANGGGIPEPVIGLGARSGAGYEFHQGEEVASTASLARTSDQLERLINAVNQLNGTTAGVARGVGRSVGGALNQTAGDASFASRYPRGASW